MPAGLRAQEEGCRWKLNGAHVVNEKKIPYTNDISWGLSILTLLTNILRLYVVSVTKQATESHNLRL